MIRNLQRLARFIRFPKQVGKPLDPLVKLSIALGRDLHDDRFVDI